MTFTKLYIETASPDEAAAMLDIYAPTITTTTISFEYSVPSVEEFRERIITTLQTYPWLVAKETGLPVGYAYAGMHRKRAAYQWSADVSVYIRQGYRGKGIGYLLYEKMFAILKYQGIRNIYAGIALPNPASVALHQKTGFKKVGVYKNVGYKTGKWIDVVWLQKNIGDITGQVPKNIIPFPEIPDVEIRRLLAYNKKAI